MATQTDGTYRYTRNGQLFEIDAHGVRLTDSDGTVLVQRVTDIPADVVVSTVLDLTLAGWTPKTDT